MDKDDDISGVIEEISLFHVLIRREDELITYPNTLILQKGVIKNPKKAEVKEPTNSEQKLEDKESVEPKNTSPL